MSTQDPLEFVRSMWSNMGFPLPGMVAPTVDGDELARRIADLKAVEGWLKTNLNLLQMTIQGLEMQRATLAAMKAMSESAGGAGSEGAANPFANPAFNAALNPSLWPWNFATPQGSGTPAQSAAPSATDDQPKG